MKNKPFGLIEMCVVVVATVLSAAIFASCIYKPDSVVKIEVQRAPGFNPGGRSNGSDAPGGERPAGLKPGAPSPPADATHPIPLMSDADAAAVEAAMKEFSR